MGEYCRLKYKMKIAPKLEKFYWKTYNSLPQLSQTWNATNE